MLDVLKFLIVFIVTIALLAGLVYIGSFVILGLLAIGAAAVVLGLAVLIAGSIWEALKPSSRK